MRVLQRCLRLTVQQNLQLFDQDRDLEDLQEIEDAIEQQKIGELGFN